MLSHAARFMLACEAFDSAEVSDLRHASQVCRTVQWNYRPASRCFVLRAPCQADAMQAWTAVSWTPSVQEVPTIPFVCAGIWHSLWKAVPQWSRPPDRQRVLREFRTFRAFLYSSFALVFGLPETHLAARDPQPGPLDNRL